MVNIVEDCKQCFLDSNSKSVESQGLIVCGFGAISSTMDLGKSLLSADSFVPADSVLWANKEYLAFVGAGQVEKAFLVIAREQTAGRGRKGRTWQSRQDTGLYFTLSFGSRLRQENFGALPLVVGLAIHSALSQFGIKTKLKWPNDVTALYGGRVHKLAGILCELSQANATQVAEMHIGVGLNVFKDPGLSEFYGVSLEDVAASAVRPGQLLSVILSELFLLLEVYFLKGFASIRPEWEQHALFLNHEIEVEEEGQVSRVKLKGLSETGGLIVDDGSGSRVLYNAELKVYNAACN